MFTFLLFSFAKSLYIPVSVLAKPRIPCLPLNEVLNNSLEDDELIFGFALNNQTRLYHSIKAMVLQASVLSNKYKSVFIQKDTISDYSSQNSLTPHTFFVIKNGEVQHCFPLPDTSSTFFSMIDFFSTQEKHVFNSKEDLIQYLGLSSYSILSPPENLTHAFYLQNTSSPSMGYIEIILCTKELIHEMTNNETTTFGFYRLEDDYIQAIGDETEDVYLASYPIFRILRDDDFNDPTFPVVALFSEYLTVDQKNFLISIAEQNQSFIYGWADQTLAKRVNALSPLRKDALYDIAFVSLAGNYYYNVQSIFTDDFVNKIEFSSEEWTAKTMEAIEKIKIGEIKAQYRSEPVPDYNPVLQKVVGKTYVDFISNSTSDCLMLFMRPSCPHCSRYLPEFMNLAQEFFDNKVNLRFGYIDVTKNSCEMKYPSMPGVPHLVLFKENGTKHRAIWCERERTEIIRYLKEESNAEIPIEIPPPDLKKLSKHLFTMMMTMSNEIEDSEQKDFQNYLESQFEIVEELKKQEQEANKTEINETRTVETEEMSETNETKTPETETTNDSEETKTEEKTVEEETKTEESEEPRQEEREDRKESSDSDAEEAFDKKEL